MATWLGPAEPEFRRPGFWHSLRALLRGVVFVSAIIVLMLCFWVARGLEVILGGRRLSGAVIWFACAFCCWLFGLRVETIGRPMDQGGARVANHSSWMDIFVIRAASQIYFVAKSEVRSWPVLGFIADQTGTMFIARKRTEAKRQEAMFAERLARGDRLCFFPEGTSSDGMRVLPFKSTLFSAFVEGTPGQEMWVQPVTVFYQAPAHLRPSFFGWWGSIGFGAHLIDVMAHSTGAKARVHFHTPVRAQDFADRKALSQHCEREVRAAHDAEMERLGLVASEVRES